MKIHCPICSTGIEVEEAHAGNKGRCMNCGSKFIIPVAPDEPVEILERGEDLYCPVCSTQIGADGVSAGDKCRCMSCEAKFIIPESRSVAIEILERGKSSAQKSAPRLKVAVASSTEAQELKTPAAGGGGASVRTIVVHAPRQKSGITG
ncbi:MAG: hypothetical protein VCA55_12455, partial [Verrucomicrobiales bacterium]